MHHYNSALKCSARTLRLNQTDSEQLLWSRLRRRQLLGVQFYRQKPLGNYIVDFYAPRARLVVEVDGSQHFEEGQTKYDQQRTTYLEHQGLQVLRFTNLEVLQEIETVVEEIFRVVQKRINPPALRAAPL
ncbi:MAG: endonuclease domain-containing protein [Candidatus Binatia bacterium]